MNFSKINPWYVLIFLWILEQLFFKELKSDCFRASYLILFLSVSKVLLGRNRLLDSNRSHGLSLIDTFKVFKKTLNKQPCGSCYSIVLLTLTCNIIKRSLYNALHKKWRFPLRNFSINVTKSAVFCVFGHIYWRNT